MSKPETFSIGVPGFVAFEAKPDTAAPAIDWQRLSGLPPFCMFLAERYQSGVPAQSPELYSEYCQWHEAKGYWPNETPLGEIKDQRK